MDNSAGKWDRRFLELAQLVASWSKDRSHKVGCVIVSEAGNILSTGFNGFPRGCRDSGDDVPTHVSHHSPYLATVRARIEARHERPKKYAWAEHAERNAIYSAARHGIKLEGATIYVPWFPCTDCMRAIIQSGIGRLVCQKPNFQDPRWGESFQQSDEMADEAGLRISYVVLDEADGLRVSA